MDIDLLIEDYIKRAKEVTSYKTNLYEAGVARIDLHAFVELTKAA